MRVTAISPAIVLGNGNRCTRSLLLNMATWRPKLIAASMIIGPMPWKMMRYPICLRVSIDTGGSAFPIARLVESGMAPGADCCWAVVPDSAFGCCFADVFPLPAPMWSAGSGASVVAELAAV